MSIEYSTLDVEASRRFDYWNDVVCRTCIPAASRQLAEGPFNGQLTVQPVGSVDISAMSAPLHLWSRDAYHLRIRSEDDLWIGYMRSGNAVLNQEGREVVLDDGDLTLYDAARPFIAKLTAKTIFLVRFPRTSLLQRFPAAERMTALHLNCRKPAVTPLRLMIEQAADMDFQKQRPGAAEQVSSTLLDLLGIALEFQSNVKELSAERDLFCSLVAYIKRNFLDPDLCLELLAHANHVSTRTVTRAFAKHNMTAMSMVWQLRLEASHRAIKEGRSRNVTEAALEHCFSNVSHFSQAFRKAYGYAPHTLLRSR